MSVKLHGKPSLPREPTPPKIPSKTINPPPKWIPLNDYPNLRDAFFETNLESIDEFLDLPLERSDSIQYGGCCPMDLLCVSVPQKEIPNSNYEAEFESYQKALIKHKKKLETYINKVSDYKERLRLWEEQRLLKQEEHERSLLERLKAKYEDLC